MSGPFGYARGSAARHAVVFAGLLALAASAGVVVADQADGASMADWDLTLRARNALWDDPTLAKLKLGVKIRQGVATLHGPVPSTAVAEQAVQQLKKVPGIRDVINETYVPPADEPLGQSMPHPVTSQRPSVPNVSTAPDPTTPGPVPAPAAQPQPAAPHVGRPTAAPFPPVAAPVRQASLAELIEEHRRRDRRFQNIRVEVRDGWVLLRGTVTRPQDAWEFADIVSQLPGVTRVSQSVSTGGR